MVWVLNWAKLRKGSSRAIRSAATPIAAVPCERPARQGRAKTGHLRPLSHGGQGYSFNVKLLAWLAELPITAMYCDIRSGNIRQSTDFEEKYSESS